MTSVKLTKYHIRDLARLYVADLLQQEQMPPIDYLSHDQAEYFMDEVLRVSERVRASARSSGPASIARAEALS